MKLKEWRRRNGNISQHVLARALGVGQSTVQRVEDGFPPTLRNGMLIIEGTDGEVSWRDMLPLGALNKLRGVRARVLKACGVTQ